MVGLDIRGQAFSVKTIFCSDDMLAAEVYKTFGGEKFRADSVSVLWRAM